MKFATKRELANHAKIMNTAVGGSDSDDYGFSNKQNIFLKNSLEYDSNEATRSDFSFIPEDEMESEESYFNKLKSSKPEIPTSKRNKLMNTVKENAVALRGEVFKLDIDNKKLDIEIKKLDIEDKKLDIEIKKLDIEDKKLDIEIKKLELEKIKQKINQNNSEVLVSQKPILK